MTLAQLTQLKAPVIVFIQPLGYKHFAVIRGIDRGRVYLAGRSDEETIESYPLMIPRSEDVQPELRRTHSLIDLGIHARTLPLR